MSAAVRLKELAAFLACVTMLCLVRPAFADTSFAISPDTVVDTVSIGSAVSGDVTVDTRPLIYPSTGSGVSGDTVVDTRPPGLPAGALLVNRRAFAGAVNGRFGLTFGVTTAAAQAAGAVAFRYYLNGSKVSEGSALEYRVQSLIAGTNAVRIEGLDGSGAVVFDQTQSLLTTEVGTDAGATKGTFTGTLTGTPYGPMTTGIFTITTSVNGKFTVKLRLGGTTFREKGAWDAKGTAALSLRRKAPLSPLTLQLTRSTHPTVNRITALLTDGTVDGPLVTGETFIVTGTADAAVWNAKGNPATADIGKYTVSIASGTSLGAPNGFGCGTLAISASGRASFAGFLADGLKFSFGTVMSKDHTLPIYLPLYRKLGTLAGVVVLLDTPDTNDGEGSLQWERPANAKAKQFADGFATTAQMEVSRFTKPTKLQSVLTLASLPENVTVVLTDANGTSHNGDGMLAMNTQKSLNFDATEWGLTSSLHLKMNVSLAIGTWNGTIPYPVPSGTKLVKYVGVVFQKTGEMRGFHLEGEAGGTVRIEGQ